MSGDYDIPEGLVFSLPVKFSKEDGWQLVKDLEIEKIHQDKIKTIIAVSKVIDCHIIDLFLIEDVLGQ